jgi:hypothetical protein
MPEGMKAVDSALDRVASRMTPVIQNRALDAGWPKDVAASLSMVRRPNGTLGVHVDGDENQAADLEFGSYTSAPRSVLSSFQSPQFRNSVEKTAKNSMDELLDRMRGVFS